MNMANKFKNDSIESYYDNVRGKKAEIAVITWMQNSKYNNILITKDLNDGKLILDDAESCIWRLIFDNYSNIEQIIDAAMKKGIEHNIAVMILKSFIDEGIVIVVPKNIWEDEDV